MEKSSDETLSANLIDLVSIGVAQRDKGDGKKAFNHT